MESDSNTFQSELNCLSKSDGSAKFVINDTIQLCAVFGPGEVKIMKEMAERAYINVVYKPRTGIPSNREKMLEYTIRSICDGTILTHLHPRTAINIIIQELQINGNHLACALNALCLALLDASIPLKYTFAAINCGLVEDQIKYFPTLKEEKIQIKQDCSFTATLLFDSVDKELISICSNGCIDQKQFNDVISKTRQYAIDKIFPLFELQVKKLHFKSAQ